MKYKVIVETDVRNPPKEYEITAAVILAEHFESDIVFLRPGLDKTPDVSVCGIKWELKSPTGNSKKTMENNLRTARKQSENIIIDLSRSKTHLTRATSRVRFYLRTQAHSIKHLKIITKGGKVIDIL